MIVMRHATSGAPYLAAEHFGGHDPQRRRRLARPSDPGAARPVHAPRSGCSGGPDLRGPEGRDPRRRAPFACRALEHLGADRSRRRPVAVRPGHAAARVRGVGRGAARAPAAAGSRDVATSMPRCAMPTSSWPCGSSASGWRAGSCLAARIRGALRADARRLARAKPGRAGHASGPDERGRRDRARCRGRRRGRVITDQVTNGVAVRMALLYLLAGAPRGRRWLSVAEARGAVVGRPGRRRRRHLADLEISRAWLVDPASGREGPGEIVVEDGVLAASPGSTATRPTASTIAASSSRRASSTCTPTSASRATRTPRPSRAGRRRPRMAGSRRLRHAEHDARRSTRRRRSRRVRAAAAPSGSPSRSLPTAP